MSTRTLQHTHVAAKARYLDFRSPSGIANDDDRTFAFHGGSYESALDERQQVGVDHVGMRRRHTMRVVLVRLQRAVLEELGCTWTGGLVRTDAVVLDMP